MEENYKLVNQEVVDYVTTQVFPRYGDGNGHGLVHIKNVIQRSLDFAQRINNGEIKTTAKDFKNLPKGLKPTKKQKVDYDICFVVAAFHDLGRDKNQKLHHLVSAAYLLNDDFMEEHFSRDQLRIMADAIMDHRASNELDPVTIYGRIVSSADRDTDCYDIMRRAFAYNQFLHPERTEDESIDWTYKKICKKFAGDDAYSAKKMYFENPAFEAMLAKFTEMSKDPELFRTEIKKALAEQA
ncbi:HD domain-containing protein [Candidatus Saccharibacteria bacterium]|nr:HD domain-containing protein [Candidatus Saccharibacteria bacterium]